MSIYDFIEKHGRQKTEEILRGLRVCEGSKVWGSEFVFLSPTAREFLRCLDGHLMYRRKGEFTTCPRPAFSPTSHYAVSSDYKLPTDRECRDSRMQERWKKAMEDMPVVCTPPCGIFLMPCGKEVAGSHLLKCAEYQPCCERRCF